MYLLERLVLSAHFGRRTGSVAEENPVDDVQVTKRNQ